jgi:cytoskeletal protein RodZ
MQLLNTALLNTAARLSSAPIKKIVLCGVSCVLALVLPGNILAQDRVQPNQPTISPSQTATATASPQDEAALSNLPDSPGAAWAREQDSTHQQQSNSQGPTSTSSQTGTLQAGSSPSGTSQDTATQDQSQKPQRPVGTAAAEAPKVNGITAAQPAGVAIAPAKQHRVRTIVLRVGAIVGAGVAVGTVVALTEGTSSKPPGAH